MVLTEKNVIDKIEILENCIIQVRLANVVERDGVEIARTFNRYVLVPGADLSGQDTKIVSIANVLWTQEVVDAYNNSLSQKL
jgi:hypothetical protein